MTKASVIQLSYILVILGFVTWLVEIHWRRQALLRMIEGRASSRFKFKVWLFVSWALALAGILIGIASFFFGFYAGFALVLGLNILSVLMFAKTFGQTWSGASDRMLVHIAFGLLLASLGLSTTKAAFLFEVGQAWIAAQITLSYFFAGLVKARNPLWWKGEALLRILSSSPYRAPEFLRQRAIAQLEPSQSVEQKTSFRFFQATSIGVILFELSFPLVFLQEKLFWPLASVAFLFHLINSWLLGLSRFTWVWIAGYPALAYFCLR